MKNSVRCLAIALVVLSLSCSKEKKEAQVKAKESAFDLSSTIVGTLPPSVLGFIYWNTEHPAYQKLRSSPWGQNAPESGASPLMNMPAAARVLKGAGLDPNNRKDIESFCTEGALFILPLASPPGDESSPREITGGLLLRSSSAGFLESKLSALKKSLHDGGTAVEELTVAQAKGFRFDPSTLTENAPASPAVPQELYVGWNNDRAVFVFQNAVLTEMSAALQGTPTNVPLLTAPDFLEAAEGLPSADVRFLTGFFDLARAGKELRGAPANLPLRSLALGWAMKDAPEVVAKLSVAPKDDKQRELFAKAGSPVSTALLAAVPKNPLLFFTLEGKWFAEIPDSATVPLGAEVLRGVVRAGIAARTAPLGQSMLPIPDAVMLLESNDAEKLRKEVETYLSTAMAGMGGGGWQEKNVDGTPVKVLAGGFGLTPHTASIGKVFMLSSSETLLKESLNGLRQQASPFSEGLSAAAKEQFREQKNVGSLYIDFVQLASFLENMQELLKMYAPQQPGLDQQNFAATLNALRSTGAVSTAVSAQGEAFFLRVFYEAPRA